MELNKDFTKELIYDNFYDEAEILGEAKLNQCIDSYASNGHLNVFNSEHGSNLELAGIIGLIALVIDIIDVIMKVVDRGRKKGQPEKEEDYDQILEKVKKELSTKELIFLEENKRKVLKIIKEVQRNV